MPKQHLSQTRSKPSTPNQTNTQWKFEQKLHENPKTQMSLLLIFLVFGLGFSSFSLCEPIDNEMKPRKLISDPLCPMNFDSLRRMVKQRSKGREFLDVPTKCHYLLEAIRVVRSDYLRKSGFFTLPPNTSEPCWDSYQNLVDQEFAKLDVRSNCEVHTSWISESCKNISTREKFESLISEYELQKIKGSCSKSLQDSSVCDSCLAILSSVEEAYFRGHGNDSVLDCKRYPFIYAAAFANKFGPTNLATAKCLFSLDLISPAKSPTRHKIMIYGFLVGCLIGILGAFIVVWYVCSCHKKNGNSAKIGTSLVAGLELIGEKTNLVKFTFEEMKEATGNFSRVNLIGKGGYGNVYRGVLADGSEVALKRFKNCSISGDSNFKHEVEVIASVRHVNLLALRGYCTEMVTFEAHQRLIVSDLMRNGSLHDHLFEADPKKISWAIRKKIVLGTARGLAYLHNGARISIVHRDVKASNILLDETFEPKLADFGFAKFTPDGFSHLSTRVAGTLGYVAPEYALYGQLTDRSDVYGFGVVFLEVLSGKKAVISVEDGQALLLTDWAWSLVKEGRPLDVIDEGMTELGEREVMEKYVLLAVLSVHPLLYARPSMEQIVKILEADLDTVFSVPDRSLSVLAEIDDIERSVTRSSLGFGFSSAYQKPCFFEKGGSILDQREDEKTSPAHEQNDLT